VSRRDMRSVPDLKMPITLLCKTAMAVFLTKKPST